MATSGRDEKLELLARQPWAGRDEDLRWLARIADEVHVGPGATVAAAAAPARWAYAVLEGAVALGDEPIAAGTVVIPARSALTAVTEARLLAIPLTEDDELRRRFPKLGAPVERAPRWGCPAHRLLQKTAV